MTSVEGLRESCPELMRPAWGPAVLRSWGSLLVWFDERAYEVGAEALVAPAPDGKTLVTVKLLFRSEDSPGWARGRGGV